VASTTSAAIVSSFGVQPVKKGRHRRYEEARALKRTSDGFDELFEDDEEPCPECAALPGHDHRSWCTDSTGAGAGEESPSPE
jgi:hypothetical protein